MKDQLFDRKILFSLLAVVMCLGFTAMSYGQAVVSVDPAEVESPAAGEELMVNVNIMGGADVAGYQVHVNFDTTALEYVSSANGSYVSDVLLSDAGTAADASDGNFRIYAAAKPGVVSDGDGTLATVTFKVLEAKASAISLTDVIISDSTSAPLDITIMDSMVTVAGADDAADAADDAETDDAAEVDDAADDAADAADDTEEADDAAEGETPAEGEGEATEGETEAEMPVSQMFEVTLTNLTTGEPGTGGQVLSPPIFVTHAAGINLAPVGEAASPALVALAENGDTSGLAALAAAAGANAMPTADVVPPGGSATVTVTADMVNSSLSVGSMLVSTNDAFIAATDVALFDENGDPVSASLDLMAYDAGSEDNTEMASDIPGPLGLDEAADPPMSNERVPTEGGVIAAHEGIQGVGDVTEAFAWEEPTAMLTITPVEAPAEPVVEEPTIPEGPGFTVMLEAGLNMVSIPLMPAEPYTAKSLAEMLGATVVIQLDAATQSFMGYTVADEGDGFGIDGGKGYIVNTPAGGMVKFTGDAWDNQPEQPEEPAAEEEAPVAEGDAAADAAEEEVADAGGDAAEGADAAEGDAAAEEEVADAGGDAADAADAAEEEVADAGGDAAPAAPSLSTYKSAWAFIVTSDIHGMDTGTAYTLVAENLRTGIVATENITSVAKRSSAVWADLNRKSVVEAGDRLKVALYDESGRIVSGPFQRTVTTGDIRNAFLSLQLNVGDIQPQDTLLAQNFPNPFNPETWIPYQLSAATEVKIDIYDVSGHLVRSLDLGWQPTGSYMTPSSAAYWDGKNAVGERVASGIYFYTLQTSDFAATRRMVILK